MEKHRREAGSAALYRLEVTGHLDSDWAEWFGGTTIRNLPNGNMVLICPVSDQAALNGLINKVHALGLSLISVNQEGKERKS